MISGDYDNPIIYQDLASCSMNQAGMSMIGGTSAPNTSYLGGVTMKPQLCQDKIDLINKKDEEGKVSLKKAGIALGALLLIGFIPYFRKNIKKAGGIGKYLKNQWNALKGGAQTSSNLNVQSSKWQNLKNAVSSKWQNFKGSLSAKWQAFKDLFKEET